MERRTAISLARVAARASRIVATLAARNQQDQAHHNHQNQEGPRKRLAQTLQALACGKQLKVRKAVRPGRRIEICCENLPKLCVQ
jgi:hypothetical protein